MGNSGLCPLRCGKMRRLLEALYSFQAFTAQRASDLVLRVLELIWGE